LGNFSFVGLDIPGFFFFGVKARNGFRENIERSWRPLGGTRTRARAKVQDKEKSTVRKGLAIGRGNQKGKRPKNATRTSGRGTGSVAAERTKFLPATSGGKRDEKKEKMGRAYQIGRS